MNLSSFIKQRILDEFGSVRRFANKINIPTSTLATALNKENGFNTMPVENALKVCKGLGIDIESLYDNQTEILTVQEKKLIELFQSLSMHAKEFLMDFAEMIKNYDSEEMITLMPMINEGKIPTVQLDYYDQAAGMGSGQIVENPIPEKINIASSQVPAKTDFVIRVYGDSMEPTFHSNDKLFIQSTNVLDIGDIGVFNFNGEQLVKEFGKGVLISHNKEYSPIKINEDLYIQGKVLGKV